MTTKTISNILITITISSVLFLSSCKSNSIAPVSSKESSTSVVAPTPDTSATENSISKEKLTQDISVETANKLKDKPGVIMLDVREPFEYKRSHINGVLHIPKDEVLDNIDKFIDHEIVIVTCRSGNRSGQITQTLRSQGHINVHNMSGGLKAWKRAGYPVE